MAKRKRQGLPFRRPCGNLNDGSTLVQSLVFSKQKHARGTPRWNAKTAKSWAREHGYVHSNVDETPNTFRIRQFDPGACQYRSVPFGASGIQGVLETPHPAPAHVVDAVERELTARHGSRHTSKRSR